MPVPDIPSELHDTLPSTTIVPARGAAELERAIALLGELSSQSLLAFVQIKPGPVIGEGGMGVIREAEQVSLRRTVALKALRPGPRDPNAALGLLREAWITGSLQHPNVVPVYHLGLDADQLPVLVLKRVEGVTWSSLIGDAEAVMQRFGATDLLAWNLGILMQLLNAVRFAHSRGILHRDLKPANVMIGAFGEVYLLDWGIAVSLRDDSSGRFPVADAATQIAGTPAYMAPEMLAPNNPIPLTARTDVYLAGAVLFELIAGRPPHQGANALAVMTNIITSQPEPPSEAPAELAAICRRAMDPDPENRYESAEAVQLALQGFLEHRGSDRVLARAQARLDDLIAALASPVDQMRDREEIHRLFGACRFGFHEALALWHENEAARTGIGRAILAVAEYELANNNPSTAVTLLGELDDPPPLLATARVAAAAQVSRRDELERLEREHDLAVARRPRYWFAIAISGFFTVLPLFAAQHPDGLFQTHEAQVIWALGVAVVIATYRWFARASLETTLVNRRMMNVAVFVFGAQALLACAAGLLGLSLPHTAILMLFLYFVSVAVMAITVDARLLVTAIGFGIAFILAAGFPEVRFYALSGAAFVFTLNVIVKWRGNTAPGLDGAPKVD